MGNAAVMQAMGNFGKRKFIIKQQFFCFLYFMDDYKLLDSDAFYFGEYSSQVIIVVTQLFADVDRVIHGRLLFR